MGTGHPEAVRTFAILPCQRARERARAWGAIVASGSSCPSLGIVGLRGPAI